MLATALLFIIIIIVLSRITGIRSDTHMLGLAYGGELCYWYNRLVKDQPPVEDGTAIEPMVTN